MSFSLWGLGCKSRKSRNTWSNRQIWPWSTEWSRAKANRVLPRERTGHSKHSLPNNTREDSTHGHHQMVNTKIRLIIFFAAKDGEALYSQQKQDQELTVAYPVLLVFQLIILTYLGGEGNGNPLQYSCLGNPMDRGAWWVTVHGVARFGHDWMTNTFRFFSFHNEKN